jgi:4-diphosphocytidyl-2-C-methyl-D-erythritol kinase
MKGVAVRAGAKINLYLRVRRRRPDGYHDIETVFHGIELCDELVFQSTTAGFRLLARFAEGVSGALPVAGDNLVVRAARALAPEERGPGARASLVKRIPVGAGLGGGSSDAAATLVALNRLWNLDLGSDELRSLARSLGSDVTYCLSGGTALGRGVGDRLEPLSVAGPLWLVLGISHEPLSTADVYARWRAVRPRHQGSQRLVDALSAGDIEGVAAGLHNDLELPATTLRPELERSKRALLDAGALGACMSGSGPTMFALARDRSHAGEIAERARRFFDSTDVVASRRTCVEFVSVRRGAADTLNH